MKKCYKTLQTYRAALKATRGRQVGVPYVNVNVTVNDYGVFGNVARTINSNGQVARRLYDQFDRRTATRAAQVVARRLG